MDYWRGRIKRPVYTREGEVHESPNWAVEFQFRARRANWSLGTANKDAAAGRAKEIYLHLVANGWEATTQRYRPQTIAERKINLTIGQYIEEAKKVASGNPKTLESYSKNLRKIVSDVFNISVKGSKFDHGDGHARWLEGVQGQQLSKLTPARIQEWKLAFIKRAGNDPIKIRSARTSANSILRCAKSLFSKEIIRHLAHIELPNPLPFDGVEFEPRQNTKYFSTIQIPELIAAARKELAETRPEAFKILLLALFCGLRRREIDLLEWTSFGWENSELRIQPTRFFTPKSQDSIGSVPFEAELLALFRGYHAKRTGPFVIESDRPPRPDASYNYYRAEVDFTFLANWLRQHDVQGFKPLHVLRKQFGSEICSNFGIYAASRALRHSSIAITAAYYTDATARGTVGLGHLLGAEEKIITLPEPTKESA